MLVVHVLPGGHLEVVKDPLAATLAEAMDAVLNTLAERASREKR
jgi:thioesterase domain-containing protein